MQIKCQLVRGERTESFTSHQLNAKAGDMLYLYTDGYADQFGGPKGKKFKYKQLNAMLVENSAKNINEQLELLINEFNTWKGDLEQVDDVCYRYSYLKIAMIIPDLDFEEICIVKIRI
ncbi:MAG: SpoIIE family protein phosphatase [Bacteroidetes bacterium]|nr:SpoIIE family protein phosphatase [Bacteroidota bacterium]